MGILESKEYQIIPDNEMREKVQIETKTDKQIEVDMQNGTLMISKQAEIKTEKPVITDVPYYNLSADENYNVGIALYNGCEIQLRGKIRKYKIDKKLSWQYMLKAAVQGNSRAQRILAFNYEGMAKSKVYGHIKVDYEKAFYWYVLAANNASDDDDYLHLAMAYSEGKITPKNIDKAIYWYEKIKFTQDSYLYYSYACCLLEKKDPKAIPNMIKAAELNNKEATLWLIIYYFDKKEYKKAQKWLNYFHSKFPNEECSITHTQINDRIFQIEKE